MKIKFLISIILLASFLRLWQLGDVPPSPSVDEVSIGYNAYSIFKTEADEYGVKFPLVFRAYDDWQAGLYHYFVIPFISIFGLNILSERLPSVLLSIATVFATYIVVKTLFKEAKPPYKAEYLGLFSALLLAISPWHIYMSRIGFQVNTAAALFVFGMAFFLRKQFHFAFASFALSVMAYHTEKVFMPVVVFGLLLIFRKELFAVKKKLFIAALIGAVMLMPLLKETFGPYGLTRLEATNVFTSYKNRFDNETLILAKAVKENDLIGQVVHNRRILAGRIFLEGYISHFNPTWLFANTLSDGAERHKVPGLGLMYFWEAPLILFGFLVLIKVKFSRKTKLLIFLWFFASPLAASITTDAPHAVRSYVFLPTWQIFSSLGVVFISSQLRGKTAQRIVYMLFCMIVLASVGYFYRQYFEVFPKTQSESFQYALSQATAFVLENEPKYDKIIVSNKEKDMLQSYMFFLFHSRYEPKKYHEYGGTVSGGFAQTHVFDKFEFRPIVWKDEQKLKNTLYVGNLSDFPEGVNLIFIGYYLDGKPGVKVVRGNL